MDTQAFLRHVLPHQGLKVLAVPAQYTRDGVTRQGWKYTTYQSTEAMAEAALQLDAAGKSVYFATQGFGDWYEDLTGKRRLRTQDNVVACRSLYDDFDVDPENAKKYPTRDAALQDIIRLAKAIRLTPTITSSGGGFHAYFTAEDDMTPAEWLHLAQLKRGITSHLGMRVDHAVDMDTARILRPIGTHNRKTETPRPVELVKLGKVYSNDQQQRVLADYTEINQVAPAPISTGNKRATNPFAAALGEYPPSSAHEIVQHCAALRTVAEAKGDVDEPVWRAMLGLVKYTVEGEALAHAWSAGHPAYDEAETQAKMDNWAYGPTLCAQFDQHIGCKADCPHAEKVRSPIRLGSSEAAPGNVEEARPATPPAETRPGATLAGVFIPHWPAGYRWDGQYIARAMVDGDGVTTWFPFLRALVSVVQRVRTEDGTWSLLMQARETNGDWREFTVPTSDIASPDALAKSLAQHEVFVVPSKGATTKQLTAQLVADFTLSLQQYRVGVATAKTFGWDDDFTSFTIGTRRIFPNREDEVICGGDIPEDSRVDFGVAGSLEEWIGNIDRIYNRPGAEIMQFALCHAFGSPLVKLVEGDYHGLPMVLVGESGHGKTAVAAVASTIYGSPKRFIKQGSDQGSTIMAAIKRVASMNNLPSILDEVSGRTPTELISLSYALANGRDKERLGQNGKFTTVGGEWHQNSFVTSNDSVHELLAKDPNYNKVEATQLRLFEVAMPAGYIETVFPDIPRTFVENHQVTQYGHAGRKFIRFVIENQEWVRQQLRNARAKYNPHCQEATKERFYTDAIVVAMVAGKIAQRLGLIQFDMKSMVKWAFSHVQSLRDNRMAAKVDVADFLAQFVSSLHGRMIVTKHMRDGRQAGSDEMPLETLRAAPVGRVATESKKVFVACKAVSDWCKENNVSPVAMRNELDRTQLLVLTEKGPSRVVRISAGTTVLSSPARCYELDYNALYGSGTVMRIVRQEPDSAVG